MCCTVDVAELSSTKLYVGDAMHNDKYVHVVAYQNQASSMGPNAMIIPFPTDKPMGPENIIDTSEFPTFVSDISEASRILSRGGYMTLGDDDDMLDGCAAALNEAQVFDVGTYTVILATSAAQIPAALQKVPESKRPVVTLKFLLKYGQLYPKQPIAVCCWNGKVEAEPLLWWYEPKDPNIFFIPTMDAHNGEAPDLEATVMVDHLISVGSGIIGNTGSLVTYNSPLSDEARKLLPTRVHGTQINQLAKNGDMFVNKFHVYGLLSDSPVPIIKRGTSLNNFDSQYYMNGWE